MFEQVSRNRLAHLTAEEDRLLHNVARAYEDFSRDFVAGHHQAALRNLLNGLDAAASLYNSLIGNTSKKTGNKAKYKQLFDADTPYNPPVALLDRRKGKVQQFSLSDIVYFIRCAMDHSYDDLDATAQGVDAEVRLSWSLDEYFRWHSWTMPSRVVARDHILINAYHVIEKASGLVHKLLCCIDTSQRLEERTRSLPIRPEDTHVFQELLVDAGLVKRTPISREEMTRVFPDSKEGASGDDS